MVCTGVMAMSRCDDVQMCKCDGDIHRDVLKWGCIMITTMAKLCTLPW